MMNLDDYRQVDGQVIINHTPIHLSESQEALVFDSTTILRKDFERAKSWYLSEVDSETGSRHVETQSIDLLLGLCLRVVAFLLGVFLFLLLCLNQLVA